MLFETKPKGILFKAGKTFSFVLMLGFFLAVLYLIFFQYGFLGENLLLFGAAILTLVIINVVFPRVLDAIKKNELSEGMKHGAELFAEKFSHAISVATLSITYIIGVGLVFVVSRIFGKRFMEITPAKKQSYWLDKKEMGKSDEMF
ncbi:MAG: hypothetical protein CL943_01800 [Candidatus Diapherotrites archaeon]|uniref:Uncharacterized protein n=1 Tax=Candidatus Iainarchaeum sp. TaxID=3101447 RepID=A0A2D6M0T0_9ARCH|nr:hypothetical protein [Candidatus Diapherotrites archaeon]|tara:strand:- start:17252 stop:17689 length:438 start_codon:yes stop_codon:yes gene_type:complete